MSSTSKEIYPVGLHVEGGERLVIEWSDGARQSLRWATLRRNCPCAGCRTERERPPPLFPILKLAEAAPPRPRAIEPVGRYAYQFLWHDGHDSGIYTFELLRSLGNDSATKHEGG